MNVAWDYSSNILMALYSSRIALQIGSGVHLIDMRMIMCDK